MLQHQAILISLLNKFAVTHEGRYVCTLTEKEFNELINSLGTKELKKVRSSKFRVGEWVTWGQSKKGVYSQHIGTFVSEIEPYVDARKLIPEAYYGIKKVFKGDPIGRHQRALLMRKINVNGIEEYHFFTARIEFVFSNEVEEEIHPSF